MTVNRSAVVSITAVVLAFAAAGVPAQAAELVPPDAEIFATNNTAVITDPQDPRLRTHLTVFAGQVAWMIGASGAEPVGSTLLSGVFWSDDTRQTTYERSREFHVDGIDAARLHHVAERVRARYHQESVLTFRYLPSDSVEADAAEVDVPGIDVQRLHDGLVANPDIGTRLGGGSVTSAGHLILVVERADLDLAHRFVVSLGGDWAASKIRSGVREFVAAAAAVHGSAA